MRDVKAVGDAVVTAVKGYVAKAHDGLAVRIDAGEANFATLQAQVAALQSRVVDLGVTVSAIPQPDPKQAAVLDSLERRASRQADHLAGLESRVQTIEHGKVAKK